MPRSVDRVPRLAFPAVFAVFAREADLVVIVDDELRLFPIVHVSKLKPVREFPSRPELRLTVPVDERFDFDEELLPKDSWETRDVGGGVYEVEQILDVREGRNTRYGRTRRGFHVKWLEYDETSWVDELDLNCGGLVYDFLRQRTGRSRFGVMQSHEDAPVEE
ncbi:hypothetical protein PHMEG_00011819 [Phytophthora megakarya]|uniref:Chromo domain-containing protein n=1 Tax=Phytophthora megakarya TaxID=4795 RepID=A0A225WAM7_9STRA|nr:hypothetical protein PHMEG_00011819 [Phytophthora megakarya]